MISRGLRVYFIVVPNSSHNTDVLNYNSSIDLPGRSILEELILCNAPTSGQYGKILPGRLNNTESLNFNIIMFREGLNKKMANYPHFVDRGVRGSLKVDTRWELGVVLACGFKKIPSCEYYLFPKCG